MNSYYQNLLKTITDSVNSMNQSEYEELVNQCYKTVKDGNKIIASGLGKNVPICEKFVGTLNSLGIPAEFLHTNTAMHGDLGIVRNGDLLIVLSKSGNTLETVSLLDYVKNRNIETWLMTFGQQTKSEKYVKNVLRMALDNEGDKWNIVPNNSTTVFLIILQGIAIELADRLGVTLEDFKMNHPGGAIGEALKNGNN